MWKPGASQNEARKVRHLIVPYTMGDGLDLGCGPYKPFPHMIGIDIVDNRDGVVWKNNITMGAQDLSIFTDRCMDFVFSSHLLHLLPDPAKALAEWWRLIKQDGHLVLYLPDAAQVPKVEGVPEFTTGKVIDMMAKAGGWDLVECQNRRGGEEYSLFMVFKRLAGSRRAFGYQEREKEIGGRKTALCVRLGGIGDMVQTASVVAGLKDQGYHVTLNCHVSSEEVMRHDPNVDRFILQQPNQVPNVDLGEYWGALAKEYDKFVNLSESVEGTLLAMEGRPNHLLSKAARHKLMNVNYIDFMHAIAEVEAPHRPFFYESPIETRQMDSFREKLGAFPVVYWCLAGSGLFKFYPHIPDVVLWLLQNTPAKIVFTGDHLCQHLEYGTLQTLLWNLCGIDHETSHNMKMVGCLERLREHFGGVNRVICKSGAWSVRESLAFAHRADIVVGPETGILNAVSMRPTEKVVIMSHSSVENLTRDWVNCQSLVPDVHCHPCHRLHHGFTYCHKDEATSAAICAASISPKVLFEAIVLGIQRAMANRAGVAA